MIVCSCVHSFSWRLGTSVFNSFSKKKILAWKKKLSIFSKNQAKDLFYPVGNKNHLIFGFNFLREERRKGKESRGLSNPSCDNSHSASKFSKYALQGRCPRPRFTDQKTEAQKSGTQDKASQTQTCGPRYASAQCRLTKQAQDHGHASQCWETKPAKGFKAK